MKISVISATYNSAKVLPGLIESLRAQEDKVFDWVIVDGGSSDGTIDLIRSSGDVVSKYISEPDQGIYDALNKALRMVDSGYYLVLGADDRLFPDAIAKYRKAAEDSGADVVTAKVQLGTKVLGRYKNRPVWLAGMMKYISNHSVGSLMRTSLHSRFGFYSLEYPICADQLFVKTVFQGNASLFDASFVAGTCGSSGASSNTPKVIDEISRIQIQTGENFMIQKILYLVRMVKWGLRSIL